MKSYISILIMIFALTSCQNFKEKTFGKDIKKEGFKFKTGYPGVKIEVCCD
jgi:hypothetical protein